jgi:hypothetical protein
MTDTSKAALKLALEALENGKRVRNAEGGTKYQPDLEDKTITAIKQALAAPVQEMTVVDPADWVPCTPEWVAKGGDCDKSPRVWNAKECNHYHPATQPAAKPAPVQEPVAWLVEFENGEQELHFDKQCVGETQAPLYTTPPAAPVQPIIGSYLQKDNSQFKFSNYEPDGVHHNKPAVPDAFGTREGEHPQYIQGWNDCRQAMMEIKK